MLPRLFLTLAEELARADDPASCRTAISRAYYAAFHTAERLLDRMGFHRPKRDHHVVLEALDACPIHSDRWKSIRSAIAKANITGADNLVDTSSSP